jgi:SSS family solute:Na+ symporter
MYRALWSFVTVIVTFRGEHLQQARPVAELNGLVYGATKLPKEEPVPFYKNEWYWAASQSLLFWA